MLNPKAHFGSNKVPGLGSRLGTIDHERFKSMDTQNPAGSRIGYRRTLRAGSRPGVSRNISGCGRSGSMGNLIGENAATQGKRIFVRICPSTDALSSKRCRRGGSYCLLQFQTPVYKPVTPFPNNTMLYWLQLTSIFVACCGIFTHMDHPPRRRLWLASHLVSRTLYSTPRLALSNYRYSPRFKLST